MEKIAHVKLFPVKTLAKQILITVIQMKGHFYRETSPYMYSQTTRKQPANNSSGIFQL